VAEFRPGKTLELLCVLRLQPAPPSNFSIGRKSKGEVAGKQIIEAEI